MRSVWGALLFCVLCLCCVSACAERLVLDGVEYELYEDRAEAVGIADSATSVTWYAQVNGLPVSCRTILDSLWEGMPEQVQELILTEGVEDIPDYAFGGWSGLERVVWPDTLRSIGEFAFGECDALREVHIPEGVVRIGVDAFCGCESLERVSLPTTLETLEEYAFAVCNALEAFEVAEGNPFYEDIDGVLFRKADQALFLFPAGRDGDYAIPSGTTKIERGAFSDASNLRELSVPEGFTELSVGVLDALRKLERIALPATLERLEPGALPCWGNTLARIEVAEGNPVFRSVDGVLFEGSGLLLFPDAWGRAYDVPAGTTHILDRAFAGNDLLETVSMPRSVTRIGAGAFEDCTALKRVALSIALERIGQYAFRNCIDLEQVALPPGLKLIEEGAFTNCTALRQVQLPDSLQYADPYAFYNCSKELVLGASRNSEGHWLVWMAGTRWAEPGKRPTTRVPAPQSKTPAGVVNNKRSSDQSEMRVAPSKDAELIELYPNGTTVEVLGQENGWARVRVGESEGYIFAYELRMTDELTHRVRPLWARRKLGEKGKPFLLYRLPLEGTPVRVIDEDISIQVLDTFGVWYKVLCLDEVGYVQVQELDVARVHDRGRESTYFVVSNPSARDRLHLRREASAQSESLGMYFNGTQVRILEWGDTWMKVSVDGKEGYMMVKFLSPIPAGYVDTLWTSG